MAGAAVGGLITGSRPRGRTVRRATGRLGAGFLVHISVWTHGEGTAARESSRHDWLPVDRHGPSRSRASRFGNRKYEQDSSPDLMTPHGLTRPCASVRRGAGERNTTGGMRFGSTRWRWDDRSPRSEPEHASGVSRPSRQPSHRTDTATAQSSSPRVPRSLGIQPSAARLDGWPPRVGIGEAHRVHSRTWSVLAFALFPGCAAGVPGPLSKALPGEGGNNQFAQGLSRAPMAAAWWSDRCPVDFSGIRLAVWLRSIEANRGGDAIWNCASCVTS